MNMLFAAAAAAVLMAAAAVFAWEAFRAIADSVKCEDNGTDENDAEESEEENA